MRRVKKSRNRAGIVEIEVLYPDNLGASWVRAAVPVKAPKKILFQGKSISSHILVLDTRSKSTIEHMYKCNCQERAEHALIQVCCCSLKCDSIMPRLGTMHIRPPHFRLSKGLREYGQKVFLLQESKKPVNPYDTKKSVYDNKHVPDG